jgi:hypothetical protein
MFDLLNLINIMHQYVLRIERRTLQSYQELDNDTYRKIKNEIKRIEEKIYEEL